MDLRNNNITIKELMANPKSKQILLREFSGFVNPQMIAFASNMTLGTVLGFASGRVMPSKINDVLNQLKSI